MSGFKRRVQYNFPEVFSEIYSHLLHALFIEYMQVYRIYGQAICSEDVAFM